ncbi:CrcB family protein [Gordonia alkaliphila]|uniref:Fluoride-specific ion channel FluC n=1 Tax=Gordonia alkaliphila TaxID=1053547 RepID=A0ABP8ZF66_9ACTN|nr:CrcB family protein [Gordonia alkaliphila]MCK0441018.1 CrcB family protein [Gordonia alkaliphila]
MLWVFLGGLLGAPARYLVEEALGDRGGFPLATFVVNVVGALALGLLLESLVLAGPETPGSETTGSETTEPESGTRRRVRLCLGTGFLGTFTTYSSFAVQIELLAGGDRLPLAAAYAAASLSAGLAAVALGIWAAHGLRRAGGLR